MSEFTYPLYTISRLRMMTDGNGITSLVGSIGCPLRCKYCLNPHSWNGEAKANYVTADELYEKLKIDNLYFLTTGGGVTFGGGESLLHAEFIAEFARKYKHTGWKFYVETSLNVPAEKLEMVLDVVDAYSVDSKDMDPVRYNRYTGGDFSVFENNLKLLLDTVGPEKFQVRVPYIEGYNTREQQLENEQKLRNMGVTHIDKFDYVIPQNKDKEDHICS